MRYGLLASVTALSSFTLLAAAASIILSIVSGSAARRLHAYSPASRASVLFHLRIAPTAFALVIAFGVVLPIFLWFETRETDEPVAWTMGAAALAGAVLLVRGASRAYVAWRSTRRIARNWVHRGRRLDWLDSTVPAYAVDDAFPTVAVVGVFRPSLFVAERVLRECTPDEVRAMVSHECAHVAARDNLKRFLFRACPHTLSATRALERAWTEAAEQAADAAAAAAHPRFALDLAQALIHVARLVSATPPSLASAFYLGGSIDARVRRLIVPPADRALARTIAPVGLGAFVAASALAGVLGAPGVYEVVEAAIRHLP